MLNISFGMMLVLLLSNHALSCFDTIEIIKNINKVMLNMSFGMIWFMLLLRLVESCFDTIEVIKNINKVMLNISFVMILIRMSLDDTDHDFWYDGSVPLSFRACGTFTAHLSDCMDTWPRKTVLLIADLSWKLQTTASLAFWRDWRQHGA